MTSNHHSRKSGSLPPSPSCQNEQALLKKLNEFTRREHRAEEVYLFTVILCDNEIDRDFERFTLPALEQLQKLFIGKTGIFDHDPKGSGQTARIFDAFLETDPSRKTAADEPYTCLKAHAYMVRTASNEDLIKEIDGGIKKEVSIACSAAGKRCSLCGADHAACSHQPGKTYQGKLCHLLLEDIQDAYEWSFVAIPAQRGAGVVKRFSPGEDRPAAGDSGGTGPMEAVLFQTLREETERDIVRFSYLSGSGLSGELLSQVMKKMDLPGLCAWRKALQASAAAPGWYLSQLAAPLSGDAGESGGTGTLDAASQKRFPGQESRAAKNHPFRMGTRRETYVHSHQ